MINNSSFGEKVADIVIAVFLIIFSVACILPLIYVISYSFTPYELYLEDPTRLIPPEFSLLAYERLFNFPLIYSGYQNTLFITIVGTFLNVSLLLISAYPLSKAHLKGRNFIMKMIIFTMFFNGGMIPNYMLMRNLDLINTHWALILPGLISAYNLVLVRNFISNIPISLEEAAFLEGANELQILWKIIVPLSKPVIATFTLFHGVAHWNSYFNAVLYTTQREMWPIMLVVRELVVESGTSMVEAGTLDEFVANPFTVKMATVVIAIVPIMCVYPFLQKYFMKGMLLGSVKG